MKFIFLTGGALGFGLAAAVGMWAGRPAERVFLDASVGCLAGALLFRWYWRIWLDGVRATYLARLPTMSSGVGQPAAAAAPAKTPAAKPTRT